MHMNIVNNNWGSFGSVHFFDLATGSTCMCYAVHNPRRPVLALEFSTVLSIYVICFLSASNRLYSLGNVFVELECLTFIWLASSYTSTQFSQNGAIEPRKACMRVVVKSTKI